MKFTQIPENTFKELILNAGILVDTFTPASGTIGNIIAATSGGVTFTATPTFVDFGADIDNCPSDTKELKKLDYWTAKLTGTMATLNADNVKSLLAAAKVDGSDNTKIIPNKDLATTDFKDLWWVGDYSDKNGTNGGFCAIHLKNALSTTGLSIASSDGEKGKYSFEYTAHYSIESQDEVPFEIYLKAGT